MYIHNKAMENLKKCSRCKSNIDISYFGLNRKKEPYKTCDNCRSKKKQIKVQQEVCKDKNFLDYYVNLPIVNLVSKQEIDIQLESIVAFSHKIEICNNLIFRSDGEIWKYKDFTELDPIEYWEGVDPSMDYMPDECAAPVLVKVNGITYRASMLTWFPLTDFADAIKLKKHVTNKTTYPVYIEKRKCPMTTIMNAVGFNYIGLLQPTDIQIREVLL